MTDKNMVKVTVEINGNVEVIERESAFIVAIDRKDDGVDIATLLLGNATVRSMGEAIASSLEKIDAEEDLDLTRAVMQTLALNSLMGLLSHVEDEGEGDDD